MEEEGWARASLYSSPLLSSLLEPSSFAVLAKPESRSHEDRGPMPVLPKTMVLIGHIDGLALHLPVEQSPEVLIGLPPMLLPSPRSIKFTVGQGKEGIIDFTSGSELLIAKAKNGHLAVVSVKFEKVY